MSMDCGEAGYRSHELFDGALAPKAAGAVREHLASCAACGRVYHGLAAVAKALSALPAYSLGQEARARILAIWASHRQGERRRTWTSAVLLSAACSGVAGLLWLVYAGLNASNGQTLLDLLLNPGEAEVVLRLSVMNGAMAASRWWSAVQAVARPLLPAVEGGVLATGALFAAMAFLFLIIELHGRFRSAPRLGEYL